MYLSSVWDCPKYSPCSDMAQNIQILVIHPVCSDKAQPSAFCPCSALFSPLDTHLTCIDLWIQLLFYTAVLGTFCFNCIVCTVFVRLVQ